VSDKDIRAARPTRRHRHERRGYVYVNIDDLGGERDANECAHEFEFPDMKALADYVHSKGEDGIYSSLDETAPF